MKLTERQEQARKNLELIYQEMKQDAMNNTEWNPKKERKRMFAIEYNAAILLGYDLRTDEHGNSWYD